jgi:hypothetical protein
MSFPEKVTLKNAGSELILTVTACSKMPVGKYPEISFIGTDHAGKEWDYRMPQLSADRQLTRANLTYASAIGQLIRFSRDPNPADQSKPYHGLTRLGEADYDDPRDQSDGPVVGRSGTKDTPDYDDAPHPADRVQNTPQTGRIAPPSDPAGFRDDLYLGITRFVLDAVCPLWARAERDLDEQALAATINTLYIQASRR